jgi:adenylate kinase family enzyme
MEQTTIQISKELASELQKRKLSPKESYENVIWDLVEDTQELSKEVKEALERGRQQMREGKVVSWEEVKKRYTLDV